LLGLVVPVLRGTDQLGFADIEKTIANLGKKARDNQLTLEDMTGGFILFYLFYLFISILFTYLFLFISLFYISLL